MRFDRVCIEAVSCELPPVVVTSDEIEDRLSPVYDRLRLPKGRLELMTGIRERRFWANGSPPSDGAAKAGQKALTQAGMAPDQVDCLVHAAVSRDFLEPATASVVHRALGLSKKAAMFDVSNACLSVLNAMVLVATMIESGQIMAGLVVAAETAEQLYKATIHRILTDHNLTRAAFKKHFASLTIGSAAAAVLLTHADISAAGHRLLGGALKTNTEANTLCMEDTHAPPSEAGPLMTTDSEALLHAGCELADETWALTRSELGWTNDTPDVIFTHQVGTAHRRLLFDTLGLPMAKDCPTVEVLGNTGAAALPSAFALGASEGKIKQGDHAALLGIGSGLSSLMLGVVW